MPHEESLYPADWLRLAERDWRRVEQLLDGQDRNWQDFACNRQWKSFSKPFFFLMDGHCDESMTWELSLMRRSSTMPLSRTSALYVRRSLLSTLWNVIPWL
jgi:hypothetical protein